MIVVIRRALRRLLPLRRPSARRRGPALFQLTGPREVFVYAKPVGQVNFMLRCPFHTERSPSCVVFPRKRCFSCFGCGATGLATQTTEVPT